METHSAVKKEVQRPPIGEVIGRYITLRKSGRELWGICPFHAEKTPSFSVNEDKGLYYCHGCHDGGDLIRFVEKIESTNFIGAIKVLGIDSERRPRTLLTASRKRAAELAVLWVHEQRAKLNVLIAEKLEQRDLADDVGDFELAEVFDRELLMLRGFYDALEYPFGAAELLAVRTSIESITEDAEISL